MDNITPQEIDLLIEMSDPDGVWALLGDMGYDEAQQYIEENYFE